MKRSLAALMVALLLFAACAETTAQPSPTPDLALLPTIVPATPASGAAPASPAGPVQAPPMTDEGASWVQGDGGIELRRIRVQPSPDRPAATVVVVRVDPATVRLRVGYTPERPRSLRAWVTEHKPLLAINGGFFTPEHRSTALVISDGIASGASYTDFGGMLAVSPQGEVSLRPLRDQPYDTAEPLDQALQSFPMLVFPGGVAADVQDNGARARRSVVAQDRSGRLLFLVTTGSSFTLAELAQWLAASNLEIDRALNLDGGSSTGLFLDAGQVHQEIDSYGPLPLVILVERRG